jgi:ATP-binding cassette, subfamily B, bacterial
VTACVCAVSLQRMPANPPTALPHAQTRQSAGRPEQTEQTPLAALWRTREYLRPYYVQLALMLAAAITAAAAEIAIPLVIKGIIDGPITHKDARALLPLGLAATALGVLQAALSLYRRWAQASAITSLEQSMRDALYAHLQRLHAGFHDDWQSGQLLSRATTDLAAIRRFAGFGTIFFVTNVVTFVAVVALLIRLNWWLGLLTGCVFLPVVVLCTRFERRYRVLSRRSQDQQGDLATYVEEAATGVRVLKALGRRDEAAERHLAQAALVQDTQVQKATLRGTFWAGLDLLPNAVIGMILLLGALAVSRNELSLGGLVAFITLALQMVWPIESMGYILASGQEAATAAQRVYEIFDTDPAITDPAGQSGPAPSVQEDGKAGGEEPEANRRRGKTAPSVAAGQKEQGRLRFDRVTFRYPNTPTPVLHGVTLELEPGETVALVGPNGSGKSTLLQLVPRLAEVSSGSILLDGTDVRDLPLATLRSAVGCAFEDPTLFSASVRENVSYGKPDADEEEVLAALAVAQADFVADLPWGLDTRIGEQGMALSGGQRQRVALARAILARPAVLLLDDPLSALDVHTEAKVTRALEEVMAESTALVVAHRPSTVMLADRVALLDRGVIVATGSHRGLLATQAHYRSLMSGSEDEGPGLDPAAGQGLTGARR